MLLPLYGIAPAGRFAVNVVAKFEAIIRGPLGGKLQMREAALLQQPANNSNAGPDFPRPGPCGACKAVKAVSLDLLVWKFFWSDPNHLEGVGLPEPLLSVEENRKRFVLWVSPKKLGPQYLSR